MRIVRAPSPALAGLVSRLWYADEPARDALERAVPTGAMHLAVRLCDTPIRLRSDLDDPGHDYGRAVLAGARATPWIRETPPGVVSLGVVLRPGGAALLGVSAEDIAGRHVPIEGLADELRDARDPLAALEARLLARLPAARVHPAVRMATRRLAEGARVADVIAESGYSARGFSAIFRAAVGLTPKLYARLQRLQGVLRRVAARPAPWADVAREHGYADQSHLVREFVAFTGTPPTAYAPRAPDEPNHVPIRSRAPRTPAGRVRP